MSLYQRLASTPDGARALSAARLRYQVLKLLHAALELAHITQADLAQRLGIRRSAVNQVFKGDGNVRITTLAEYLHEMGQELRLDLVPVGTQRAIAEREIQQQWRQGHSTRAVISARPSVRVEVEAPNWHRIPSGSHTLVTLSGR